MKFISNNADEKRLYKETEESEHNKKLAPCPLCGKNVTIHFRPYGSLYDDGTLSVHALFYVFCSKCNLESIHKLTPYHAAMKWNQLAELIRNKIENKL